MTKESYKLRRMIVIRQSLIIVACVSGQSYWGSNLSLPLAVNLSPIGDRGYHHAFKGQHISFE